MRTISVLYVRPRPGARSWVRALRRRGFEIETATPREVLSTSAESEPRALVVESTWPTLARIRELYPACPLLFIASRRSGVALGRALREGAQKVLFQPVLADEIELALRELVDAESGAAARGNGDLLERLEYANRQLARLTEASSRFSQMHDEDELLEAVPRLLTRTLDFDRAILILNDGSALRIRSLCFEKDPPEFVERFLDRVRTGELPTPPHFLDSFEQNRTILVPDLNADPRWPRQPGEVIRTKAMVIAPICSHGRPIGVLSGNLQHHQRDMDAQDVARFEMFANMVGLAIDNVRAYQSLERKVVERTRSLARANEELREQAAHLEKSRLALGSANVSLLAAREELVARHREMERLLDELSERREELQAILDVSQDAILLVGPDDRVLTANRRVLDYFGMRPGDLENKDLGELLGHVRRFVDDPGAFDETVRALRDEPCCQAEEAMEMAQVYRRAVRMTRTEPRFVSVFSLPVRAAGDRELGRVWIFSDITRLKKADELLRLVVEASPLASIITRLSDGKILYANGRMGELVGLASEELIGRNTPEFYFDAAERAGLVEALRRDGFVYDYETRIKTVDGAVRWTVFSLVATELDGEPVCLGGIYDVSERKRFEEELEKERNFVSAVLDTAGALVVVLDPEARIVRFNRACERTTGYTAREVIGKPFWFLLLPEEKQGVESIFAELRAGGIQVRGKNHWITRSGERRLIEWSNTTLTGPDGSVEYVVATGIDITERYAAQQKLRLYRQIFDRSLDGILVFDREGRFIERNPAHRQSSGLADESLVDQTAAGLFGEETAQKIMTEVRASGGYRGEIMGRRGDGRPVPIDVSVFSIQDEAGEPLYYVGIGRDVSERKRAEEALRRAHDELEQRVKERTAELAELNAALMAEVAERKQAERALRESQQKLARQNAVLGELAKRLSPDAVDRQTSLRELTEAAAGTLEVGRASVWLYRKDRSVIECVDLYDARTGRHEAGQVLSEAAYPAYFHALAEQRVIAAHDAHADPRTRDFSADYLAPLGITSMLDAPIWLEGAMTGVVCCENIGAPRRWTPEEEGFAASLADFASLTLETHQLWEAERALRRAHDELESRVQERTAELARANLELREAQAQLVQSEKMASLGMLVAGIAHEINTPVGAIISMHDTLVRAIHRLRAAVESDRRDADRRELERSLPSTFQVIEDANRVIESAATRVATIVRRLRSFARLDEADLKRVDIHDGLDDTIALIQHELKHHISVDRDYGRVPPIECYPGRLNQVFLNLLNNARQAIPGNGTITIRTAVEDGRVHVSISDTGVGISPENLKKIFDPGFTTKGVGVGTGLGLSICYQIVKDHGGEIRVESEVGKGSTFTVVLPMSVTAARLPKETTATSSST